MNDLYKEIESWALSRFGIKLHDHQIDRIKLRVEELQKEHKLSKDQYRYVLDSATSSLLPDLIDTITVKESYFFRDQSFFLHMKEKILPALIEKRRQARHYKLGIWSAGSARGEEIYSLAILLKELLPDFTKWELNLYATDINFKALEGARQGCYSDLALRATSQEMKEKYFHLHGAAYCLNPEIVAIPTFEYHNLSALDYPPAQFDIIICRNVFIYLDKKVIEHVLEKMHQCLVYDGYLFLGSSDFINYSRHKFFTVIESGVVYFRKHKLEKVEKKQEAPQKEEITSYSSRQKTRAELLHKIQTLMQQREYTNVLRMIDDYIAQYGESALLYQYKAEVLIDLGDMDTAMENCLRSIQLESFNPVSFFLKGLLEIDLNKQNEAFDSLKRAIYLKRDFPEAHYHMGLLLMGSNQKAAGLESLSKALEFALKEDTLKKVIASNNENMQKFAQAIKKDVEYYKGLRYAK